MRYVAAYLLAVLGGNKSPSANDIEKVLGSVGIESESEKASKVISQLTGKDINQIVELGKGKLASMPVGGGVAVSAAAATTAAPAGGGAAPAKKEEKKEEVKDEESDEDLGFGLFD